MNPINYRKIYEAYYQALFINHNQAEWMWLHCYEYFSLARQKKLTATELNMLSLHLSVYLAQENMYHGSSFLLQNGYKIHREAIRQICHPRYQILSGITCETLAKPKNLALLTELTSFLTQNYSQIRQETYLRLGKIVPISPISQSLITKILLGTLGCVPAFDKRGVKQFKVFQIAPQVFSTEAVKSLLVFYKTQYASFNKLRVLLDQEQVKLPEMKELDIVLQYESV